MVDATTQQAISLLIRVGRSTPNIFKLLKQAMEKFLSGKRNEIDIKTLKTLTNGNINEFEFSKRSEDDFNIFKDCLKEFDVKYAIKKSKTQGEDGLTDYYFYFDCRDQVMMERCFKECVKRMDIREAESLDGMAKAAEEKMYEHNKDIDLSQDKNRQKHLNKNKDMNLNL